MEIEMVSLHRDAHEVGPEYPDTFAARRTHAAVDYAIAG